MDNILNNDLNYDDNLINEASKPFLFFYKREQMRIKELILYHYQN